MNTVLLQAERDHLADSKKRRLLAEHFNDLLVLVDLASAFITAQECEDRLELLDDRVASPAAR
jgi:hypothetical protein